MEDNYKKIVYTIPTNTESHSGTVLNGNLKTRNLLECACFSAVAFLVWYIFTGFLGMTAKIIFFCFFNLPIALISLTGVNGESLYEYLSSVFNFRKKRRVLLFRLPEKIEEKEPKKFGKKNKKKY